MGFWGKIRFTGTLCGKHARIFRWDFFSIFDVRLRSWIKFLYSNKNLTTLLCDFWQLTLIGIFGIHWKLEWPCTNKSTFSHHILISDIFFVGTISTVCLVPFPAFGGHLNIDTCIHVKNGWRHALLHLLRPANWIQANILGKHYYDLEMVSVKFARGQPSKRMTTCCVVVS